ncbi:MAG: DUF1295 domain-containing protein [Chitinophagales bacterium]
MTLENINLVSIVWMIVAIILLPVQLKITAPYGRHTNEKAGFLIPNKLGWFLMELPSLLIMVYFLFRTYNENYNSVSFFLFFCWILHYINRTIIFPLRTKTANKKMPVIIVFSAIFFNGMNAPLNGYFLFKFAHYTDAHFTSVLFILGLILFITGAFINNYADTILINLRKPGHTEYAIPKDFLFNYISAPNLFGEMIEWIGFALMAQHLPALSFAVWTICNLLPRAVSHHNWYLQHFPDYPKNRKAVIPFLV